MDSINPIKLLIITTIIVIIPLKIGANTDNVTLIEEDLKLTRGNSLWTNLIIECHQDPSMLCVQKFMYNDLKNTFAYEDEIKVTNFMKLVKNSVDYEQVFNGTNTSNTIEIEDFNESRSLDNMSRSLHDKALKFIMTHNLEIQLPETLFEGTTLRLSPRSLEGPNEANVKVELLPGSQGRFFKKLRKRIGDKLMWAFMAIILVIKFIAAKFMFILPTIVGAVTAKKILMKVLLFLFPFLSHFFKFCAYVPHGTTKFHHHKHKIAHIHLVHKPPHHHHHHHPHHHPEPHDSVVVISPHAHGPPSLHHSFDSHHEHEKDFYDPYEEQFDSHPGGLDQHYFSYGEDRISQNKVQSPNKKRVAFGKPLTPSEIEMMLVKAEKEAKIKTRLQQERLKIHEENARLQDQLKQALKLQEKLKQQAILMKNRIPPTTQYLLPPPPAQRPPLTPQYSHNQPVYVAHKEPPPSSHKEIVEKVVKQNNLQPEQILPVTQTLSKIDSDTNVKVEKAASTFNENAFEQALHEAATITYDPFYSPILDKIDKILIGLGFTDESCRERLICSMYSNPEKFSPHSNLLSAELSRDSKELQKPTTTNAAVVRFYRYVQAARDGQDKRDCLRLYANCSINTEL